MLLQEYLSDTHEFATPEQWGVVQSSVPHKWIEQALQMNGVATLRKRRLPMEQALWLVLGVALLSRPLKKSPADAGLGQYDLKRSANNPDEDDERQPRLPGGDVQLHQP